MDDTPKPKQRKYVISPKINEVLESHFSGELSLLQESKLSELYNQGIIDLATKKECSRLRKLYEKSEKGEITLQVTYQTEKLVMDKSVRDILRKHFDGDIKNIRATRLNQLVKDKTIQPSQKKQLMELKKSSNKRNADDLIQYVPSEEKPEADEPEAEEAEPEPEYCTRFNRGGKRQSQSHLPLVEPLVFQRQKNIHPIHPTMKADNRSPTTM